jgi:type IV pilus assembly protein PilQ
MRRRQIVLLVMCAGVALGVRIPLHASGAGANVATLKKIASRVDGRAGVISIEASDPVPYIASQPDPRTFVVELRDIDAAGFADNFKPDPRHPFASVQVETGKAPDGADVARVRMLLAQPLRPRVRSARNVIFVEADRLDKATNNAVGAIATGPSSAIRDVRVTRRGAATAVTLRATGRLNVAGVEEPKLGPPQLVIDLANATSALPGTTMVGEDPINTVRIGLNQETPLFTRVIMDLTRRAAYRFESSPDGNDLTVVFEGPADAQTALPRQVAAAQLQQAPPAQQPQPAVPPAQQPAAPAPAPTAPAPPPAIQGAQQPAAGQPAFATPTPTRYTGVPISLDFQGADLRAVLRTFAEISGLNVVIDPSIQGTVDVALRDVPWDQALDIILRANRLGYSVDGTIVRIAPLSVLADEEAQRQKLAEAQALAGTLETRTFALSYARSEQLQPLLVATVLSQRGSTQTDVRSNTLIITDLPERLARAADLINTLDQPEPQVEIEARIVQTTRDFARRLGIQWGFQGRAVPELGNTLPLTFPNSATIQGNAVQGVGPNPTAANFGVTPATSGVRLALGAINGAFNLDVALSALEDTGQARLLSTPRVTTQNNIEAQITQGVQIPIQTVANNTVTVTFRDAALTLLVTPQITAANTVIMRITVENASPDFGRAVNNIPPINTQRAITQVLVSNGETTVIGGIYTSNETTNQDRTPGLYRIPLLGWLFQRNEFSEETRELLIFITPRIIRL